MLRCLLAALLLIPHLTQARKPVDVPLPEVASGRVERLSAFASKYVPARNVDVWLPQDYPAAGKYSVLYMQDGQMLFDAQITWNQQEWRADEVAGALIRGGSTRPFIIVGIWNAGAARHSEYFPQKPFESLSRRQRKSLKQQARAADLPASRRKVTSDRYLKFIVDELKPHIDSHFETHTGADQTFIAGSSMGGLISLYAMIEYPEVFGGAACLSTHWPGSTSVENNPVPDALLRYIGVNMPPAKTHRIYFDHGTATLDALYPPLQARVDALLRAKDYTPALWQTRVFEGADHSEKSWSQRLHEPLKFLLAPLPRRH